MYIKKDMWDFYTETTSATTNISNERRPKQSEDITCSLVGRL
jgi:hypothetical protein